MGEKSSIHYIVAHEKIRNLVFEEWEKMNMLISDGPDSIKEYFCKLWNDAKQEVEFFDDIDIIDLDKEIKPDDFAVSYAVLSNEMKVFNFIMPKPVTQCDQALYLSLVITKRIPRLFTLELSSSPQMTTCYAIGEWQIDFQNDDYIHKQYEIINEPIIGNFLKKIDDILKNC